MTAMLDPTAVSPDSDSWRWARSLRTQPPRAPESPRRPQSARVRSSGSATCPHSGRHRSSQVGPVMFSAAPADSADGVEGSRRRCSSSRRPLPTESSTTTPAAAAASTTGSAAATGKRGKSDSRRCLLPEEHDLLNATRKVAEAALEVLQDIREQASRFKPKEPQTAMRDTTETRREKPGTRWNQRRTDGCPRFQQSDLAKTINYLPTERMKDYMSTSYASEYQASDHESARPVFIPSPRRHLESQLGAFPCMPNPYMETAYRRQFQRPPTYY
eukprot:TRINITY_DN36094_c0_g1_i1.p1 TRINITY_DN36094_c0_g1~~TRINITY_DN36094_c0_g1_i1.p1  ORF type:complete len:295 (+),score=27.45 TRINITY_DN36094_c0_g1_i1:69-887(+)